MSFLNKDVTVQLIDLLKLIVASVGCGTAIFIISSTAGWILLMASAFIGMYSVIEIYQHFQKERKK